MNETKEKKGVYLIKEPVGKLLFKFSLPCVLSMLVGALYNIVDQIFIGQSVGYLGNAATNVVYPFTVLALAIALLIGDGTAAQLSISLGSGSRETSHRCVGNGIIITCIIGIILMMAGLVFRNNILKIFGVTEGSYKYASEYMYIILLGIPFFIFTSSMNAVIRADGSPKYSMFAAMIGAVINLILDPVAIFVFNMGVKGAALATIIGQIASCIVTILYFKNPKSFKFSKESFILVKDIIQRTCQLGISSFITQVAIVLIISTVNNMIGLYGEISKYGTDIPLSVIGIVMKVFGIVIAFSVGIAVGGQPIAGYNYGARNYKRVRKTYKYVILSNIVVGFIAMLIFEFCPYIIVRLFGSESALYNEYANMCFRIYLSGILLCCIQKASSIFLQSIGKPVKATVLSLSRDVVFLIPGLIILSYNFGIKGMLWAAPIADVLAFTLACTMILKEYKALKILEKNNI